MIRFFDYRPGLVAQRDEIDLAIRRVIDSGQLILGPEVAAFEEEFADFVGCGHAVGVASGTDAITLALRALGIGPGDEVITVSNAGVAPVAGIRAAGADPRFVDVDPATWLIDPLALEAAVTPRTRAVLAVHLYGAPADLEAIQAVALRHALRVIEDCAQAHGAQRAGRRLGSIGDVGCFSFYPTKNLGALGDAGCCVTGDPALGEALREQRMYGFRGDRHAHVEGRNSRLDELQAAILRVSLRHLGAHLDERQRLAGRYLAGLGPGFETQHVQRDDVHAQHLFVVQHDERDQLIERLERAGIGAAVHYPEPVHRMQAYTAWADPAKGARELPRTERACRRVLSLPLYPGLPPADVDRVLEVLGAAP